MTALRTDDIVRTINLTDFELSVLHRLVRADINDSFMLTVEGRVPTYTPDVMARLDKLVEKLK